MTIALGERGDEWIEADGTVLQIGIGTEVLPLHTIAPHPEATPGQIEQAAQAAEQWARALREEAHHRSLKEGTPTP